MSNEPLSQQWYEAATHAVEAEAAADLLESNKSAVLSQMMMRRPEPSVAAKELSVKASQEWEDYVSRTCKARREANLLKVRKEYLSMLYWEQSSQAANERAMSRMR